MIYTSEKEELYDIQDYRRMKMILRDSVEVQEYEHFRFVADKGRSLFADR